MTNPADASRDNGKPDSLAKYNLMNAMLFAEHQQWSASSRCMMKLGPLQGLDARLLLPFLESKNDDFRSNVASMLGNTGDRRAVKPLIKQLQREANVDVKLSIIEALGKLKDRKAVRPLEPYLASELWGLRISAATALESITGRQYEFGNPPTRR